jgi:hypothetical protein
MRDLYDLFPGMTIMPSRRITPERQDRLHATIKELRVALDTEKQLNALQDEELQQGSIIKRAIASIKRRFGRCK